MANFCEQFVTYLKTKSAITTLIGAGANARVYRNNSPETTALPHLIYQVVGGDSPELLSGTGGAGIVRTVLHLYAMAADPSSADALSETVRLAPLQGFRGLMGTIHVNEVSKSAHADSGDESPINGGPIYRYWTREIYDIWHEQATS